MARQLLSLRRAQTGQRNSLSNVKSQKQLCRAADGWCAPEDSMHAPTRPDPEGESSTASPPRYGHVVFVEAFAYT